MAPNERAASAPDPVASAAVSEPGGIRVEPQVDRRRWQNKLGRAIIVPLRIAAFFINTLPLDHALELASWLGLLAYFLLPHRRRVALANLRLALGGETSARERRRIARAAFQNVARTAVEVIRFPRLTPRRLNALVSIEGRATLDEIFARRKGALALSAHLGNFELICAYSNTCTPYRNALMGRKIRPAAMDEFVTGLRRSCGTDTINSKNGIREVLRRLAQNEGVGVVLDQNMRRGVGIFVNFFGVAASTTPALALIALRRGVPILPVFMIRQGLQGRHRMVLLPAITPAQTGDRERDVLLTTQRLSYVIEEVVRRFPEQWFWFHQRWRCRPPGEQGDPARAVIPEDPEVESFQRDLRIRLDALHCRGRSATRTP